MDRSRDVFKTKRRPVFFLFVRVFFFASLLLWAVSIWQNSLYLNVPVCNKQFNWLAQVDYLMTR